jgi:hypothetical protein
MAMTLVRRSTATRRADRRWSVRDAPDRRLAARIEHVAASPGYSPSPAWPIQVPSDLAAAARRPRSIAMRVSL